jgi:Transport and Golgi organisation 2
VCTLLSRWDPHARYPVQLLGLRDERAGRGFDLPGEWWPGHPGVVGGRDRKAGGSWCVSDIARGATAVVLNNPTRPEAEPGAPSRGCLPLLAIEHHERWPEQLDLTGMATFNVVLATPTGLRWWWFDGTELQSRELTPGTWMFTPAGLTETELDPRLAAGQAHLHDLDDPSDAVWADWRAVLDEAVPQEDKGGLLHRRPVEDDSYETVFGQFIAAHPGTLRLDYLISPVNGTAREWTTAAWTEAA